MADFLRTRTEGGQWGIFRRVACSQVIEKMVRPERFELPTFWFVARRSIQLS